MDVADRTGICRNFQPTRKPPFLASDPSRRHHPTVKLAVERRAIERAPMRLELICGVAALVGAGGLVGCQGVADSATTTGGNGTEPCSATKQKPWRMPSAHHGARAQLPRR
jgi:hypothetical protein